MMPTDLPQVIHQSKTWLTSMKYVLIPLIIAVCGAAGWYVYDRSEQAVNADDEQPKSTAPMAVEVTRLSYREIEDRIELVGSLEARMKVSIRARVSGYITAIPFDVGDSVESGASVVQLDDSATRELVVSSSAALKVAEAQLRARLTARNLAETEVRRLAELASTGVSTAQEIEQAEAAVEIAQAEVELEEARVEQARSELQRAELTLSETTIASPLTGLVAERLVDSGDLAQPDEPLLTIVDVSKVRTVVNVTERDYLKVRPGQLARVHVDAVPDRVFEGIVIRKAPVLDQSTRTAAVQIEIENHEQLLSPGMYARVTLVLEQIKSAAVLPVAALIQDQSGSTVYVLRGDPPRPETQRVQTGITDGNWVQILSGLTDEDRTVTLGNRLIRPGQEVVVIDRRGSNSPRISSIDAFDSVSAD